MSNLIKSLLILTANTRGKCNLVVTDRSDYICACDTEFVPETYCEHCLFYGNREYTSETRKVLTKHIQEKAVNEKRY